MANIFIPELAVIRRQERGLQPEDELILTDADWVVYTGWVMAIRATSLSTPQNFVK